MTDPKPRHTAEPWRLFRDGSNLASVESTDSSDIAEMYWHPIAGEANANAARIVACVNAFAGLEPEAVGRLVIAARSVIKLVSTFDLRTGRPTTAEDARIRALDELREALAALRREEKK